MSAITLKERQRINHELKMSGFGGLGDPMIFAQIATLYTTHEMFRGLLMSTAPDQRRTAYESLKPHLRFEAKPLDQYEMEVKQRAEREQWDVYDGTVYPKPFKVGEVGEKTPESKLEAVAEQAIQRAEAKGSIFLVCENCLTGQTFFGKDRKDANRQAFKAGWRIDNRKLFCSDCISSRIQ